jgi:hypothetical protein
MSVDLSGRGFSTKPDACSISFSSPNSNVRAYYNYDSSSSTTGNIVVETIDGTDFGVDWVYGLSLTFTELD